MVTFGYNGNMSRLELSPDKWTKILQFLRSRTDTNIAGLLQLVMAGNAGHAVANISQTLYR